jgi:hypothetical protein
MVNINSTMPLLLEDVLIRNRADALPTGASGYFVRLPSAFLARLADGAELTGELTQGKRSREARLILEKGCGTDLLHIAASDWDARFTLGRASLRLREAIQDGVRMLLFPGRAVITSPVQACKITAKRRTASPRPPDT